MFTLPSHLQGERTGAADSNAEWQHGQDAQAPHAHADELAVRMAWADPLWATLVEILHQVNDWLKYAEAKNAAVIGLASASAAGALAYLNERADQSWPVTLGLVLAEVCLVLSLLMGLASFLPQTNLAARLSGAPGQPTAEDNLFFYGHLARYAPRLLAETMARRYTLIGGHPAPVREPHIDLAAQIVTNSRITLSKLRLFSYAVALFALAVLVFTATLVVSALA